MKLQPNALRKTVKMTSVLNRSLSFILPVVLVCLCGAERSVVAQQVNPDLFRSLHWRSIGPFRGGRTRAVAGVPSQPNVFYVAQVNGGVLKTIDYGHTWM